MVEKEVEDYYSIRFTVEDTGIGISKEKLGLIFESFTQAKSDITRKFGGSGLGLAITKKLIELQGGEITVESTPRKGSKFTFILPYAKKKRTIQYHIPLPEEQAGEIAGKKILIVEDNEINRLVARKFLEGWGLIVDEAENGKIAVELVRKNPYDLIIMDLQMPVMDGYQATRIIKTMNQGRYARIPIVALTASILVDVKSRVKEAGLDDYLIKPFNAPDLNRMITNFLMQKNP
jgi:CheY-like chemotaxis protein